MSYDRYSQMESARSVKVELEQGQETVIQLGRQLQVRGLKQQDSIIYPRFTGVHIEDTDIPFTLNDGEERLMFDPLSQSPESIVSEDITRNGTRIEFPTTGVVRMKVQIAYRVISGTDNQLSTRYRISTPAGFSEFTKSAWISGTGIYTVEFLANTEFVDFRSVAMVRGSVQILRNLSEDQTLPPDTFLEIVSFGLIDDQL